MNLIYLSHCYYISIRIGGKEAIHCPQLAYSRYNHLPAGFTKSRKTTSNHHKAVTSPANDLKTTSTEMPSHAEEYYQTQNVYLHTFGSLLVYLLSYAIAAILGLVYEFTRFTLEVAIPICGCILLVWLWCFHPSGPWQRINAVGDGESIGPWLRLGALEARSRSLLARDRILYPFRILYAMFMRSLAVAQAEPLRSEYELTLLYV